VSDRSDRIHDECTIEHAISGVGGSGDVAGIDGPGLRRLRGEDAGGLAALHQRSGEQAGCGARGQGLEERTGEYGESIRDEGERLLVEQPLIADGGEVDAIDWPGKSGADADRDRICGEVPGEQHDAVL
jgi:hypothetical protein